MKSLVRANARCITLNVAHPSQSSDIELLWAPWRRVALEDHVVSYNIVNETLSIRRSLQRTASDRVAQVLDAMLNMLNPILIRGVLGQRRHIRVIHQHIIPSPDHIRTMQLMQSIQDVEVLDIVKRRRRWRWLIEDEHRRSDAWIVKTVPSWIREED